MSADLIEHHHASCPFCMSDIEVMLDWSAGDQEYIEDCQVCCCPIVFWLNVTTDGSRYVSLQRDND